MKKSDCRTNKSMMGKTYFERKWRSWKWRFGEALSWFPGPPRPFKINLFPPMSINTIFCSVLRISRPFKKVFSHVDYYLFPVLMPETKQAAKLKSLLVPRVGLVNTQSRWTPRRRRRANEPRVWTLWQTRLSLKEVTVTSTHTEIGTRFWRRRRK